MGGGTREGCDQSRFSLASLGPRPKYTQLSLLFLPSPLGCQHHHFALFLPLTTTPRSPPPKPQPPRPASPN